MSINRVILIVLDSVGIGELPDANLYNDEGSNTLGNIAKLYPDLHIPNLIEMGLGNIDPSNLLKKTNHPTAAYGKANEQSSGKDTTTGHWEICGLILEKPFPTFPDGFPKEFMDRFEAAIGCKTIGNIVGSGTVVINDYGDEHLAKKAPIVYTSADSVFQVAMHEDIFPIDRQYEICQIARDMLKDEYEVGRVIARPFMGTSGNYTRTSRRKDFSLLPPDTILDAIENANKEVFSIGKIVDIFAGKGITKYVKTANNEEGIKETIKAIESNPASLIFTNLVDFDMLFGHRRDVPGYAKSLMEFDKYLPEITDKMKDTDLLIITADHGNDPSAPGNDHTREYIPILTYGKSVKQGQNIGIRNTFADISSTIAEALQINYKSPGKSYYSEIQA